MIRRIVKILRIKDRYKYDRFRKMETVVGFLGVEYEVNVFNDTHINVEGVYCWADIVFDKDTEKFKYMGATE